ncbi:MAG: prephenate dehydrogenase/arogenate dehydrogenase family protein [Anaerolineales bacterium]|nr:prephenate dehydrogenase/arogenate dehydrogenase family protein [Anaerolineales bacterium]
MKAQTIAIIGLNRVGVSVGLALKQSKLDVNIIGHDQDATMMRDAKDSIKAVDKTEWNLPNAAAKADILVLTVPASELEVTLQAVGSVIQAHAVVVDLSSKKQLGLDWATQYLPQGHYVGAVPLYAASWLADGRSDLDTADANLFRNAVFCLMPSAKADPQAVETAVNIGLLLGAVPYFVDPIEYDNLAQGTESMPGLLAAAMFGALAQSNGWRDMLRLAGLPFSISTAALGATDETLYLASQNKQATLRWLDAVINEMQQMRRWLAGDEDEMLAAYLAELSKQRAQWMAQRRKNDWVESHVTRIPNQSFAEQMLGSFIMGRGKDDDE